MDRWVNKVALVTGASSGIGMAIAEELVSKGMKVIGLCRRVEKVKMLAEQWKSMPGKLYPLQCDLGNETEISRAMEWIEKNLGVVEVLINNAAVDMHTMFLDGTMDEWRKTFDINVLGLTHVTKEVLTLMKRKGIDRGHIININDIWGLKVPITCERPVYAPYTCSKFALRAVTDCLRIELAHLHSNIKVSCIYPGLVETEMTANSLKEHPRLALKPKDIAEATLFMLQTPETVLVQDMVVTPIRQMV
ncbi:farnesol dehydrogenase [Cephus cinctus]|uniref:Farnesol dehydrogenase n=1 Tax=Cephus cinctus TaxID=211228 RepID=A0AAJ7BRV4_CEPCN|nr:farnesol dehydrogenase [Cephus cinctus]